MRVALIILFGISNTVAASAQYQGMQPAKVSVEELASMGGRYNESPIITQGEIRFGDMEDQSFNIFELTGNSSIRSVRIAMASNSFEDLRFMVGQKVEVYGIFFDLSTALQPQYHPVLRYFPGAVRNDGLGIDTQYFVAARSVEVIVDLKSDIDPDITGEESEIIDPDIMTADVLSVDLRSLVQDPEKYIDRQIAVLGKFRGSNLYGDLSMRDKRTPRDFVIKVADAAIWVTGRRPRGTGFRLDSKKRRDTGKWLAVVGTTWKYEPTGTYYLRAEKISMVDEPVNKNLSPVKAVVDNKRDLGSPPEVVFSLPLAGERDISVDSEFQIQFSSDMNQDSFNRNVDLLYADDDGVGNPFPDLEVIYDKSRRTLTVRPNKSLERAKEILLILYDLIEDEEGQSLLSDPAVSSIEPGAAVVLAFTTSQ